MALEAWIIDRIEQEKQRRSDKGEGPRLELPLPAREMPVEERPIQNRSSNYSGALVVDISPDNASVMTW